MLPRRIKLGSVLVREWKGRSHRVMVVADGFAYDGKNFGNLSEIAALITGTNWNGPRFFGLRSKTPETVEPTGLGKRSSNTRLPPSSHLGRGSDYRKRNIAAGTGRVSRIGRDGQ